MVEYIEREAALKATCEYCCECDSCNSPCVEYLQVAELPAADVAPVRRGRWEICSDGYYPYCSVCKTEPQGRVMTDYCPNCGAKMEGSE